MNTRPICKISYFMLAAYVALSFIAIPPAHPQKVSDVVDSDLRTAVQKEYPGAKIVGVNDVDAKSCYYPPGTVPRTNPGWVKADFNGDGKADHAVLFMVGLPEKQPQGALVNVHLAVFLREKSGSYQKVILYNFEHYYPISGLIQKQPSGMIKESGVVGDKIVKLTSPGVLVVSCGQYAKLFYWDKKMGRFAEVQTVD
jgi:hypothetical protein